jgi:hypothetical protein
MPKRPKPARGQKWPEVCSLPEPPAFEVVEARGRFPSFGAKRCQTICRAQGCRRRSSGAKRDTAGPPPPGRGGAPRGGDPKIVHDHLRAARLASDSGPHDRSATAFSRPPADPSAAPAGRAHRDPRLARGCFCGRSWRQRESAPKPLFGVPCPPIGPAHGFAANGGLRYTEQPDFAVGKVRSWLNSVHI